MSDTELVLAQSGSATFDSNGTATVRIQNGKISEWRVRLMNITTTSTTQTRCTVYKGEPSNRNQVDFTRSGNGDTSPTDIIIRSGEFLTAVWTSGTVGSVATFNIEGVETLKGRRAY